MEMPQCVPTSLILLPLMAAMRTKSAARVRKHANVEANGIFPGRRKSHRRAHHVLLGDVHFEKALGCGCFELFGVGGILDVAIEATTSGFDLRERGQRVGEGFARGFRFDSGV